MCNRTTKNGGLATLKNPLFQGKAATARELWAAVLAASNLKSLSPDKKHIPKKFAPERWIALLRLRTVALFAQGNRHTLSIRRSYYPPCLR